MSTALDSTSPVESSVDVRYYATLLWRGRYLIVVGGIVGVCLGVLFALLQVPVYQATTTIQIDPPTPTFMSVTDALMGGGAYWQYSDFYNTQHRILRSTLVGEHVVDKLGLKDKPPFQGAADPGAIFASHVSVNPIAETRLVQVSVQHGDPQTAALWANTLASVYLEESVSNRVQAALQASAWLQEQLTATQKSMRDAQEKFFKAMEGQDLYVPEGSVSAVATSITKLNDDFIAAQARRIELEAALKQVQDMRERGESLASIPQVARDAQVATLEGQLMSLNLDLSRLREKYKEAHPEVLKVQAQIAEIRKASNNRAAQIIDGMQAEWNQIRKRETELKTAIERQKAVAASQSRKVTELEALKKEAESAKSLYEVLLQKLNETDIAASIRNNNVTIVERALPPSTPIRPQRTRLALLGGLFGLGLGVALVLGREYLDNTLREPDEVERYLHIDLLAAVPSSNDTNEHLVTEAYQNLRTALIFARKDDGGQVVLITGTAPQEGKTTTIVNLGRLMASSGEPTLVVDFDLRRAQLHARLGIEREPGVTDVFVKHESIGTLIRHTTTPNLFAVTAGPLPPNPPALLARRAVGEMLEQLRGRFEWILLDSPPLASVTDALLLARHADHVVIVLQHNKVDKRVVKRHLNGLRKVNPAVLGVVLNRVDLRAKGYHYYYYPRKGGPEQRPDASSGSSDV